MDDNYRNTQQEEEIFDEELQALGIPFTDETAPKEMQEQGHEEQIRFEGSTCRKGQEMAEGPGEARFVRPEAHLQKKLAGCAKWALICGGIAMLLWWFQTNDLMAIQAAYPCIVACGILGGFGVGMHATR